MQPFESITRLLSYPNEKEERDKDDGRQVLSLGVENNLED